MTEWYQEARSKRDEQDESSDIMMLLGYVVKHGESLKQMRAEIRERLESVEKRQDELDAKVVECRGLLRQVLDKLEGE